MRALPRQSFCTGAKNTVLDTVFSYYFSMAQDAGIRVEADLDIPEELPTDATELSTVFANALENAINATKKLPPEKRVIKYRCIRFPTLMFKITTPYEGTIKWDADGLPVPQDKPLGMGSRSIAAYPILTMWSRRCAFPTTSRSRGALRVSCCEALSVTRFGNFYPIPAFICAERALW